MVSGRCLKGVWRVIESFLDQLEIQSKFNLLSTLTFTWNSSVALLSPTCIQVVLCTYLLVILYYCNEHLLHIKTIVS